MVEALGVISGLLWSPALIVLLLGAGLYFTIVTKGVQIRCIPDMLRQIRSSEKSSSGISSLESLMVSLAGSVGIGNMAGVATAIAFGGPGAVFWMWAVAIMGAASSFIECTLGQIYKEKDRDTGEYRGGPAYYIEKAYRGTKIAPFMKVLAAIFALVVTLSTGFFLPGIQSNSVAAALDNAWGINITVSAVVLTAAIAIIIIGGIKRIANFASLVVPPMAGLYIVFAIVILFVNFEQIPEVFGLIFRSAFGQEQLFAGLLGSAIMWGVKRGAYSNEAGQGTTPQSAAAAEVSHPAKQGFVQSFAVYVDTLFVCSATAFIIISTGMFKVFEQPSEESPVRYRGNLPEDVAVGPGFIQNGLDTVLHGLGSSFVAIAIGFFAFTTVLGSYYSAEVNLSYFNRWISSLKARRGLVWTLRILLLTSVFVGAVSTPTVAWALGDIGMGATAWMNILVILALQAPAIACLKDYAEQKKRGVDPEFDPKRIGIKNADFWEERSQSLGSVGRIHSESGVRQNSQEDDPGITVTT
ncbi:alanine/glycine:cation symporter family protein [Corynebacterium sp. YSMAA1_1_D6]|uniref:alanine/glycine:cation symporter family protein n=1 Tax=Corynebacterium sp. YSMAA1_1_D6 TaxID=3383589 RepID=UPI0038D1BEDE